jgi:hypothetical protein
MFGVRGSGIPSQAGWICNDAALGDPAETVRSTSRRSTVSSAASSESRISNGPSDDASGRIGRLTYCPPQGARSG